LTTALVLPTPETLTLALVPALAKKATEIRLRCFAEKDLEGAQELHRGLQALTKYVSDRKVRAALEGEQRLAEVLIGQLLGPPQSGRPEKGSTLEPFEIGKAERNRFRALAQQPERVAELVESGVTQRSQILARLEHETRAREPVSLATVGEFPILLADCPWRYDFAPTSSRAIENQYPTMTVEELCELVPPATDDAILYLWATPPKSREAHVVMEAWGFDYMTQLVWIKDKIGMGYWARQRHEMLFVGKRGSFSPPLPDLRPDSVITAPRGEHSEKPEAVYEMIERCWPGIPKAEMFARRQREGWVAWGNEV